MSENAISVEHLVKRYGDLLAVNDISFEVKKGEIFALLGPNGAGKTTTIEILECIRPLTSGSAKVLGYDISNRDDVEEIKKRIGVLPQDFNALDRLTVRENLELFASMYDQAISIDELIDIFGLKEKESVRLSNLSSGLRQRVGIAAALVNDPELVFLDEPTTGLDPESRRATWKLIMDMRAKGKTILLTTHYMEEAQNLADKVAIIIKGRIVAIDSPMGLVNSYGGKKYIVFKRGGDDAFGTLRRFFDDVIMEDRDVLLPFNNSKDLQIALTALSERGIETEMEVRYPNLEDVFLKLVGARISEEGEVR